MHQHDEMETFPFASGFDSPSFRPQLKTSLKNRERDRTIPRLMGSTNVHSVLIQSLENWKRGHRRHIQYVYVSLFLILRLSWFNLNIAAGDVIFFHSPGCKVPLGYVLVTYNRLPLLYT